MSGEQSKGKINRRINREIRRYQSGVKPLEEADKS